MKRIDFSRLNVETSIGVFETADLRSALGNLVFRSAATLEEDTLARKIFGAPAGDPLELSDGEYTAMMQAFKGAGVLYPVLRAVEKATQTPAEKDQTA